MYSTIETYPEILSLRKMVNNRAEVELTKNGIFIRDNSNKLMKSGNNDDKFWYSDFKLITFGNGDKNKAKNEASKWNVPGQVADHDYYNSNLIYDNVRN